MSMFAKDMARAGAMLESKRVALSGSFLQTANRLHRKV